MTYALSLPAVLSLQKDCPYKLPYVRYEDLNKKVSDRLHVVNCLDLGLSRDEVGFDGSKTKVIKTFVKPMTRQDKLEVFNDETGIQVVYDFLKEKGYLS